MKKKIKEEKGLNKRPIQHKSPCLGVAVLGSHVDLVEPLQRTIVTLVLDLGGVGVRESRFVSFG